MRVFLCLLLCVSFVSSAPVPAVKTRPLTMDVVSGTYQFKREGSEHTSSFIFYKNGYYQCYSWHENPLVVYVGKWTLTEDKVEVEEWVSTNPNAYQTGTGFLKFQFTYNKRKPMKLFSGELIKLP